MKKDAFTLAEVLITLGIIGVVAAMTLPALITNYKDKQTVSQLKKVYSSLNQAVQLAKEDNGPIESWDLVGFFSPEGAKNLIEILAPYLKITKYCSNNAENCVPDMYYYPDMKIYMNLNSDTRTGKAILSDGNLFMVRTRAKNCNDTDSYLEDVYDPKFENYCAWILIDINGMKKPNALGRDVFAFNLYSTGVYPSGLPNDRNYLFEKTCKNIGPIGSMAGSRGFGCTAWVIYNENLDYLYCDDLDWNGKTHCK